jgi:pimeloyl-ACP methyl ester carboxylesterase
MEQSGADSVIVAGFSRGAGFAYGQAAAHPETVAGIVALDGYFKSCAGDLGGAAEELERRLDAWRATGEWASDVAGSRGWEARAALMARALEASGTSPETAPDEEHTKVLAGVLYKAWGPGVLAHPREVSPRGVSRAPVLAQLMDDYDRYYPKIQDLEAQAAAAVMDHPALAADDGWADLRKPVIFFGSTGMGSQFLLGGVHSAAHVGGPGAQIHVLEGYGHLDVLVAEDARADVFEPLLEWLRAQSTEP